MSVASEAGIDPVALIDRLAWAMRTTADHLRSVTGADVSATTFENGRPTQSDQTRPRPSAGPSVPPVPSALQRVNASRSADPGLADLLGIVSIARELPELPVAMLGRTGSTISPDANPSQGTEPGHPW